MASITGSVATDRAGRYVKQFGQHMRGLSRLGYSDGPPEATLVGDVLTVTFDPMGSFRLTPAMTGIGIWVEADDEASLQRIVDRIERNLLAFGRGTLRVEWDR